MISGFSVCPSQERNNLTGHYGICLSGCVCQLCVDNYKKNSNFQKFHQISKFQNQNMFQAILSNFDCSLDLVLNTYGLIHFWTLFISLFISTSHISLFISKLFHLIIYLSLTEAKLQLNQITESDEVRHNVNSCKTNSL